MSTHDNKTASYVQKTTREAAPNGSGDTRRQRSSWKKQKLICHNTYLKKLKYIGTHRLFCSKSEESSFEIIFCYEYTLWQFLINKKSLLLYGCLENTGKENKTCVVGIVVFIYNVMQYCTYICPWLHFCGCSNIIASVFLTVYSS